VSSPPPIFNFDSVPTVVGGPYEYGVPGAVHGVLKGAEIPQPAGATASGATASGAGRGQGPGSAKDEE
jgi:cytochrome c oxidase subunit 1